MNKYPGVLGRHFNEDFGFSYSNHILYIIDQYHIKSIKSDQVDFYLEAFEDVHCSGLSTIIFYFPTSKLSREDRETISILFNNQSDDVDFSLEQIEILYSCFIAKEEKTKQTYFNSEVLRFVNSMHEKNHINVVFVPYSRSAISIHGRYWVTKTGGILVDGSLSTNGIVLAQTLDNGFDKDGVYRAEDDNYAIVMNEMFAKINKNLNPVFKEGIAKEDVSNFYSICENLHLIK